MSHKNVAGSYEKIMFPIAVKVKTLDS